MGIIGFNSVRRALMAAVAAAALAGCGGEAQRFTIGVDGSSTVYPISAGVAERFNAQAPQGLAVSVKQSGTGGGFQQFCRGATQVQGASRPITASELETCAAAGVRFIELPIAFDALTVVVHPSNPLSEISVDQLRTMWAPAAGGNEEGVGKIDNWRQVDPSFPDLPLRLYGPGTASGTFDYFTQAVVGEEGASRLDFSPTENDNNIVIGVSGDEGALGYFGLAYYLANQAQLKALAIKATPEAAAVLPSLETVADGTYTPLARPLFIYVNADELEKKPVLDFALYFIQNAAEVARAANYVPLPQAAYDAALARINNRTVGTAFAGHSEIGASIQEVLDRELTLDAKAAAQ